MKFDEQKELLDLNAALEILRKAADKKTGLLKGSAVQVIVKANTEFSWTRINHLVKRLGELGWREDAWFGPKNERGSKIRLTPQRITNLKVLPDVANNREVVSELSRKANIWHNSNWKSFAGHAWVIKSKNDASITVVLGKERDCSYRQDPTQYQYVVEVNRPPAWFTKLLTLHKGLGAATLYTLWLEGRAYPADSSITLYQDPK